MSLNARRSFLKLGFGVACACAGAGAAFAQTPTPGQKYVCPPCGCSADDKEFDAPGVCPACGIDLVPKAAKPSASSNAWAFLTGD